MVSFKYPLKGATELKPVPFQQFRRNLHPSALVVVPFQMLALMVSKSTFLH